MHSKGVLPLSIFNPFSWFRPSARIYDSHRLAEYIRTALGAETTSGVSVGSESALRQATVYSCVSALSRAVAQLPCHLYRREERSKQKALDHPLYPILHDQPNEWMTAPEFWGMAMTHLLLRGNFYALKKRSPALRNITELIPLAPGAIKEVSQKKDWSLSYKVEYPDGSLWDIPSREILHLRGMILNGYVGVNPIQYLRESVGLGLAAEEFGARFFGSGTHPGMVVEHPGKLSEQASDNLRKSLASAYSGLGRSHRLMLLEEGMKVQKIAIDPRDAQFLELRQFQRSEIVDIFFATPLSLMNKSDANPTYASSEQFSLGFVVYALMPWLVNIEKAIRRDLISLAERPTYFAKFRPEGLQRGDIKTRFDAYQIGINAEILSPNECRELEDMNPYEGGDEYRTRTSTVRDRESTKSKGEEE